MDQTNILFWLWPGNEEAKKVIYHDRNKCLRPVCMEERLEIGHFTSELVYEGEICIATLGRGPHADIAVPQEWTTVSDVHCGFYVSDKIVSNNTYIKFAVTPDNDSCQAYGDENHTQKLLSHGRNQTYSSSDLCGIEFRIDESKTAKFVIVWHRQLASALQARGHAVLPRRPAMADIQVLPATDLNSKSQRLPPYATADVRSIKMKRLALDEHPLGRGAFGAVHRGVVGKKKKVVAVKVQYPSDQVQLHRVEREIRILSFLRHHPNIVPFFAYGYDLCKGSTFVVGIVMGLKDGSLKDMVQRKMFPDQLKDGSLVKGVYHDVLKGLAYVHSKGLIYRDVKPANILWKLENDKPSFCLSDFGVSNPESLAETNCGSPIFMAPEVQYNGAQTTAMDLWSLLITILWTADFENFREKRWYDYDDFFLWLVLLARRRWPEFADAQELVAINPKHRATAQQMLVKVFDGEGLMTTRREEVPELQRVMNPDIIEDLVTGGMYLCQRVRPGDLSTRKPIYYYDKVLPGDSAVNRPFVWKINKEKIVQLVEKQFGGEGEMVVAPKRKVLKRRPRGPVAGQPRVTVTRKRAVPRKCLVIEVRVVVRGARCRRKGLPATGVQLKPLQHMLEWLSFPGRMLGDYMLLVKFAGWLHLFVY